MSIQYDIIYTEEGITTVATIAITAININEMKTQRNPQNLLLLRSSVMTWMKIKMYYKMSHEWISKSKFKFIIRLMQALAKYQNCYKRIENGHFFNFEHSKI